MKTFVIWNKKDNRPSVCEHNYGNILVYLTFEQAQAYMSHMVAFRKEYAEEYEIKETVLRTLSD